MLLRILNAWVETCIVVTSNTAPPWADTTTMAMIPTRHACPPRAVEPTEVDSPANVYLTGSLGHPVAIAALIMCIYSDDEDDD